MTSSTSNNRGFTLVEMLTVIAIIGILIAAAVPVVTRLTRSGGLNSALRQVSNSASMARSYAIARRTTAELRITNDAVSVFANGVQLDKWNQFPPGVIVDPFLSTAFSVVFDPTGGTRNTGDANIVVREGNYNASTGTLFGTNSNLGTITINSLLGRITINRP